MMVALRVLTMLWFLSCLRITWRRERSKFKRNFYLSFALFGVMYFLSYPIAVIIATQVEGYHLAKVVLLTLLKLLPLLTLLTLLTLLKLLALLTL